jgi:hypothetical protein
VQLPLSRLCHLPSERPQILEALYIQPSIARAQSFSSSYLLQQLHSPSCGGEQ